MSPTSNTEHLTCHINHSIERVVSFITYHVKQSILYIKCEVSPQRFDFVRQIRSVTSIRSSFRSIHYRSNWVTMLRHLYAAPQFCPNSTHSIIEFPFSRFPRSRPTFRRSRYDDLKTKPPTWSFRGQPIISRELQITARNSSQKSNSPFHVLYDPYPDHEARLGCVESLESSNTWDQSMLIYMKLC